MDEPEYSEDAPGEVPGHEAQAYDEVAAPELGGHDREENETAYQTGMTDQQSSTVETADFKIAWKNALLILSGEDTEEDTARAKELKAHNRAVGVSALPFSQLSLFSSDGEAESSGRPHRCEWTRFSMALSSSSWNGVVAHSANITRTYYVEEVTEIRNSYGPGGDCIITP
jgi:hypothetical protein